MLRGRLEMGAEYMHIKKAGARGTRQIRKGSVFISKHISPLIEWPPTTTTKPRCRNEAEIQGLILPRPLWGSEARLSGLSVGDQGGVLILRTLVMLLELLP